MSDVVLIIEDSKDVHNLVKFHLRGEDWHLEHAYDGTTGLTMARSVVPTLILLDLDLPDTSGIEVCQELQANPALKKIPVIFISSHTNVIEIAGALDAGGIDYITKPFNPVDIRARVRAGIRAKNNADALEKTNARLQEAFARDIRRTRELLLQAENMATIGNLVTNIGTELSGPAEFVRSAILSLAQEHNLLFELGATLDTITDPAAKTFSAHLKERRGNFKRFTEETEVAISHMLQISIALSHQGRADMSLSPDTALEDMIDEALIICRGRLEPVDVKKVFNEAATLTCRRSQIGQVIIKLLSHSADYLTEFPPEYPKTIRLETHSQVRNGTPGAQLVVAHSGRGFEELGIQQIFGSVDLIDYTSSDSSVGLALCRAIIEEHQGTIALSTDEELDGARFDIWLPLDPEEEPAEN